MAWDGKKCADIEEIGFNWGEKGQNYEDVFLKGFKWGENQTKLTFPRVILKTNFLLEFSNLLLFKIPFIPAVHETGPHI